MLTTRRVGRRIAAVGGVVGPVVFVGGWISGAAITQRDYSAVHDAISRLAAVGNNSRPVMTAGFVGFGIGLPIYAAALRLAVDGPAWLSAAATGISTLVVAALPLERSVAIDRWHAVAAGLGYVTLAATPLLAAGPLIRQGHRALAGIGMATGSISAISLLLTATALPTGLFQRIGLTSTDLWVVVSAAAMVVGKL